MDMFPLRFQQFCKTQFLIKNTISISTVCESKQLNIVTDRHSVDREDVEFSQIRVIQRL